MDKLPRPNPTVPRAAGSAVPRPSAHPQGGTWFLGRYRIVDTLGVGGMATVHLARVDGVGGFQKWVAIKRIHADMTEDDQFIRMFLDEARIAASISHPNVAQVFELGQHKDSYWIAMEYLHGEPLREIMRVHEETGERMSPELAARIVADAAEGLHAAHELRGKDGEPLNLVHRDVTPHNLFVTYDGTVKVVDFGIAKVAGRLSSTMAGTLKGKIAYMSPEQIVGKDVDRRADIFSLGVVLWELSTGQRLFRSESEAETLGRVRACIVPTPSMIVPSYGAELESIVMRALSKDREARQDTARELSRALQQYLIHAKAFVGSEEISQHMTRLFAERVPQRDEHLRWAAEVTNTRSLEHRLASIPSPEPARTAMRTREDVPPATQREPRKIVVSAESTDSVTNRVARRDDPLSQTRRERAFRDPIVTMPDPPPEDVTSQDLEDEPPTVIASPAKALRAAHAARVDRSRAQLRQPPPSEEGADDEQEDAGDTVVVSEAEMMAAMQQRPSTPASPGDDDDDDDDAPTMALSPERMAAGMRRAIAAPGLQRDRVQRAPAAPTAGRGPASEIPTRIAGGRPAPPKPGVRAVAGTPPGSPAAVLAGARPAPAPPSPPGRFDPAAAVAEVLAQAGVAPAATAPLQLPNAEVPSAAPAPEPLAPQPMTAPTAPAAAPQLPVVRPAQLSDPMGFNGSTIREPYMSQDFDADFYARQRSRRLVLMAALVGGFFVLLGAAVLIWSLSRG